MGIQEDLYENCFICSEKAATEEHVIPKWLQSRFNLWNELLTLPNGTHIPYRQLTIPACLKCNRDVFGTLEQKMENNNATESEVWKWACKIHYGLGYKHKFLAWDRKHQIKKISDYIKSNDPLGIERSFLLTVSGEFSTSPDLFGSVFEFPFKKKERFIFTHLLDSSSLCINTGNVGYVVFLREGQLFKKNPGVHQHYLSLREKGRVEDMLFFYANCVEDMTRQKMGHDIMLANKTLVALSGVEPFNKQRFRDLCSFLGLDWVEE